MCLIITKNLFYFFPKYCIIDVRGKKSTSGADFALGDYPHVLNVLRLRLNEKPEDSKSSFVLKKYSSSCVLGPPSYGGSCKITVVCLFVCLSFHQFGVFLRNGRIFQENSFLPKVGWKGWSQKRLFLDFLKNFVISFSWK